MILGQNKKNLKNGALRKIMFSQKMGEIGPKWANNVFFCIFQTTMSLVFPGGILKLKKKTFCDFKRLPLVVAVHPFLWIQVCFKLMRFAGFTFYHLVSVSLI